MAKKDALSDKVIEQGQVVDNPWRRLRSFTDARIGLGRAGVSLPTQELLAFQLNHAQARDAVHLPLDVAAMQSQLAPYSDGEVLLAHSQAENRMSYLQRPDLGRKLSQNSRDALYQFTQQASAKPNYDIAFAVVDGLSSLAVSQNAAPFIQLLKSQLLEANPACSFAPITLVEQGRVAIGDDIGELLNAKIVIVLVGERPGLSSPDSLGLYLTWQPKSGLNDASRNCISNIRPAGLPYEEAAKRALYLITEAQKLKLSGVNLKDRTQDAVIEHEQSKQNFLIAD